MTTNPTSRREPQIIGGPEPGEEGTDIMSGDGPGGDIMGGPDPGERTDLLSAAGSGGAIMGGPEPDTQRTDLMGGDQD